MASLRNRLKSEIFFFQVEEALSEAPIDNNGLIDIKKFANILTKGAEEEEGG